MVENLKLPLCKEKRSCYLNTKSAVKKKTWLTCLSTTNWCTIGTLRGRVLIMRLLLSLKWCTPLLRLIIQFFLMITTWFVRSIISGSFESFYDSFTPTMVICWCKETGKRKGYLFLKGEHQSSLQNTRLVAVRSAWFDLWSFKNNQKRATFPLS